MRQAQGFGDVVGVESYLFGEFEDSGRVVGHVGLQEDVRVWVRPRRWAGGAVFVLGVGWCLAAASAASGVAAASAEAAAVALAAASVVLGFHFQFPFPVGYFPNSLLIS
ncbi:hypothetical protein HEK616_10370 [Streptomyces nigrescens]|uniref:Integral membrane protein n=1 Tax=Streptomyces nigrescens TaxID=1920 RepID=A0ABM7ZMD9_STRNI|nr:hypothetical protein HEK616_10370 [Streptomyces nigrescens]